MDYLNLMQKNQSYSVVYSQMPTELQAKANHLCFLYNMTDPYEKEKRQRILSGLFKQQTNVGINSPFHCDYGFNVNFSGFAFLNYGINILDTSPVNIGNGAMIGPNVCLACSGHPINYKQRKDGIMLSSPINIGENVWIGANVTIEGGVSIGNHSVIGAGSVVTKDIPDDVVAMGAPCHIYRKITDNDKINLTKPYSY